VATQDNLVDHDWQEHSEEEYLPVARPLELQCLLQERSAAVSALQAGRPPHAKSETRKNAPFPNALEPGEAEIVERGAVALAAVQSGARSAKPQSAIGASGFGGFGWRSLPRRFKHHQLPPISFRALSVGEVGVSRMQNALSLTF
jgi:hypothetical protein